MAQQSLADCPNVKVQRFDVRSDDFASVLAGTDVVFNVHYTPNGKPATDRSYIGLFFAKNPVHYKALTATW